MADALAHRGPDGDGFFHDAGVAIGHRRLSIIDLEGGTQPMSSADGSLTVVQNGEIYNYRELRAELEMHGCRFRTNSDTETFLHGWRVWGEDLVDHLRGMFVFVLYDHKEDVLFIARDRVGKKPLHYARLKDGTLAFASEIKALLTLPEIDRSFDLQAVDDFFAYGYIPDPKTIYASVRKLPPAHTLLLKRGQEPRLRRYWDVADAAARIEPSAQTPDALTERLREAVRLRLVADVEVGAFLSGGVDSSAIVALMAGLNQAPISTFSIGFGENRYDESEYARRVAERYKTHHQSRRVTADCVSLFSKLPGIFDEPFADASAIPTYFVSQETSRFVKVCVSGDGGDEALAGYRRYAFHATEERIRRLMSRTARRAVFRPAAALYPKLDWAPRFLRAKTTFSELALDPADAYFDICAMLPGDQRLALYSSDVARSLGGYQPRDQVRQLFAKVPGLSPLQQAQYCDISLYLSGDILVKVDRASMANSLEVRAPLLDHELMAWSFALPDRLKLSGGQGKAILKKAMGPYLPSDLLYRPKQGFAVPMTEWLRGPLRALVTGLPNSEALKSVGMFDRRAIEGLGRAHLSGGRDHTKSLWLLLVLEEFLKHNMRLADEGRGAAPQSLTRLAGVQ
ncbi:MAG: asparagine synthase (glutamine-hydrolyzing) [Alphaproteobacteria bacterium]